MFNDTYGKYGASAWSATKFVATSHASVNFGSNPPRRLSQRMSFVQKMISIGWVAVRFSVARSDIQSAYVMHADLYLSDSNGHPVGSSLSHAEIPSTSIQSSGWYKFSLSLAEISTPEHGICLVIWQDGGDEDNYAAWDYVEAASTNGCSMMTDGVSWIDVDGAHRTVRAASAFDAYEDIVGADPQHRILSPPATLADGGQSGVALSDGEFYNTYLYDTPSPYPYAYPTPGGKVVALRPRNLHLSYVIDSSGSSGWNDRYSLRKSIVTGIHESFVSKFPRGVTYDLVQFGARPLSPLSASIGGRPIGVMVSVDDYDSISGYDQDGNPLSGDIRAHMGTGVVAYGFKNLSPGSEYLVYGFNTGWSEVRTQTDDPSWRPLWSSGSPSISVVPEGPEGGDCIRVVTESGKAAIRYAYGFGTTYPAAYVTANVVSGTFHVDVADNSFQTGDIVRIVSSSSIEQEKVVDVADETGIDFTSEIVQSVAIADGAVVEQYVAKPLAGWQNTDAFEMLVVDKSSSGNIVFFVQTLNGAHIEWTFAPLSEWNSYMLYFLGDTAEIAMDCVDANGDPLPDGTTVEFYVDKQPTEELDNKEENAQKTIPLVYDASSGATSVRVSPQDVGKLSRGNSIDIVDDDRNAYKVAEGGIVTYHTTTVSSVSEDGTVGITDALPSAFTIIKHASVVTPATIIDGAIDVKVSNKLPMVANLVDITPIFVGSAHSPEVLNPLDPPQANPSADPDDYNAVESMVSRSSIELVVKNGWAAVRLCPITEDKFFTAATRNTMARSMFNLDERDQVRLAAIDDMEKGEMKPGVDDSEYAQDVLTEPVVEPSYYSGIPDFTMDHKVEAAAGLASTTMKSFAKALSKMMVGAIDPVEYLVRKYRINPVVTTYNESGDKTAIILAGGSDVYFACPIFIKNTVDRTVIFKQCQSTDEDGAVVEFDQTVPGTFATDPYDVTITYDVTNRGFPANGFLRVSIYDLRRTIATRTAADDDLVDIDGCSDDTSALGNQNEFSTNDIGDDYTKSLSNMLLATDFIPESELLVPVNAGVATVTLPPLDRVALLEVHASFELDDGYSRVVNRQKIYYRNPLVVTISGTGQKAADGETRYDIGATVLWKGLNPVPDGVMVNFESESTWMSPSVSQTISGSASGVLIGPHDPIPAPTGLAALEDTGRGEFEVITAICSYLGFTAKKESQIEWMREQAESGGNFYFYATGHNTNPESVFNGLKKIWSDGLDYATINADLPASSFRLFPYIDTVADDLIESSTGVVFSGPGLTVGTRLPKWSVTPPVEGPFEEGGNVPAGWASNRIYSNMFIGRPPYREPNPDDPDPCESPECAQISIYTKSRKYNLSGTGIESDTVSFLESMIGGEQAPTPKPRLNLVEPFGVTVSIEPVDRSEYQETEWRNTPDGASPKSSEFDTYSHPIKRDGKSRYLAVAEVTWRDSTIIPRPGNPLPKVSFDVGTVVFSKEGVNFSRLEDRTVAPLDYDTAQSYHIRTSTDADHFHEVSVDDNGKGVTTATISCTKGVVIPDHTHDINIFDASPVAESSYALGGYVNSHPHRLKSVAVVGIGPISDKTIPFAVQAVSDYDNGKLLPDGTRVPRMLKNYAFSYFPEASGSGSDSGYVLEIIPTSSQYVDGKIVHGFQARLNGAGEGYTVLFHAYARTPSGDVPIADGTRIFADFGFYEYNGDDAKKESSDGDIVIVENDEAPRTIAVLKISAFLSGMPEELKAVNKSFVTSDLHWFPDVYSPSVITAPETDGLIFSEAVSSFSEVGPSRLNDAIAAAAKRMISFSESLSSSKKVIVVVSDGAESNSDISYDQAISEVKSVDVGDPVEIVFVKLERTDQYDDLVVKKFTTGLSGFEVRVADVTDVSGIPNYVYDAIVSSPSFDLVSGWYSNIVDLGADKLFDRLRFSVATPGSSTLSFSVRFGSDGVNFGDWIDLGSGTEFDLSGYASVARYMEYRISFRGDPDDFESPTVSGVEYEYYEPRRYTVLFQPRPINEGKDGYVGEVIFAHQGAIPETSTVSYGVKHAYGGTADGYWSTQQPGMQDGFGSIVLSRVNELLVRNDSRSFTAAYGGWTPEYDVSVYRMSVENKYGSKVPETSYTYNPDNGNVVFGQSQPDGDTFTLTLSMKPVFRIAMDIVNRGPEAASIDYVGTMYRPVDKSYMYDSDRRPVYSALETDFVKLGVEPSGNLTLSSVIYANLIGDQSDTLVDIAEKDTVYYVLSHSAKGEILVTTLRQNFTAIERSVVSGVVGAPTSMAFMDGVLYVCVLQDERRIVHRLSDTYASAYHYDIGAEYENSGVIRSKLDVWYTTDGSSVFAMTRSFTRIGTTDLSFACGEKFYFSDGYTFVSELGDIIIVFSGSGIVNMAYILPERSEGGNVSLIGGRAALVRKSSISIF